MDLPEVFRHYIETEKLFSSRDKLLLAVSGGLDSVVLCELCHQAGLDFVMAHANFQLRGEESGRDEQFVRDLAKKYDTNIYVHRFDTLEEAAELKVSVQVAARELRYAWFNEIIDIPDWWIHDKSRPVPSPGTCSGFIVTAHHLDDNIETLLMNFFKGTGIAGLRAILPKQGRIVRPLLFAEKDALRAFARAHQLEWVEDSSNTSNKYTRNYFRNQVIPLVRQVFPGAMENLAGNLPRFRDIEELYRQSVERHKKKLLEYKGSEVHIPVLALKKSVPLSTLVYEIIQPYGFSPQQVGEVIDLLDSDSGRYILSSTHRILKNRGWLIISPLRTGTAEHILIETAGGRIDYENGSLKLELTDPRKSGGARPEAPPSVALLDAGAIHFPLLLRKWTKGDYFYPLGMRKKKKLARFFIDNKLSLADKEKVWVIEMDKKIIWVVGHRIDDRFRIGPETGKILKIEWKPA